MYLASDLGVDAIGLVFCEDSARYIDPQQAAQLISERPPFLSVVGLFKDPSIEAVERVVNEVGIDYLQFHGQESEEFCTAFDFPYIKAIAMGGDEESHALIDPYSDSADMLLFDSHCTGGSGGSGVIFDWQKIPSDLDSPIIIAGGLNADNVAAAIAATTPFAVDVSSGIEVEKGIKSEERMRDFMRAVRTADLECYGE